MCTHMCSVSVLLSLVLVTVWIRKEGTPAFPDIRVRPRSKKKEGECRWRSNEGDWQG